MSNIDKYLRSWGEALSIQSSNVRDIIGSRHWLSDGQHKESIIKEFLIDYLPSSISVDNGFVCSLKDGQISKELDIVISNDTSMVPVFKNSNMRIVTPGAALATLEVKTVFGLTELKSAVKNVESVKNICGRQLWSSICFFQSHNEPNKCASKSTIESRLRKSLNTVEQTNCLPTTICCIDSFLAIIDNSTKNITVKVFLANNLSFPLMFFDMQASICSREIGEMDEFEEMVTANYGGLESFSFEL